jgi:hypothetical protein
MSINHAVAPLPTPRAEPAPAKRELRQRWRRYGLIALGVMLCATGLAMAGYHYQEKVKAFFSAPTPESTPRPLEPVTAGEEPGVVLVAAGVPLEKRLTIVAARTESVETPVLTVTGSVIARLASGRDDAESRWDFATTEIASAYGDWIKARADVAFAQAQALKVKGLAEARVKYLTEHVERLDKLVKIGTEEGRTLSAAKADLLQADIQGQKDVHEAENAVKVAERSRGLLERQLFSVGIDPETVRKGDDGLVLLVADVPESKIGVVHKGQECRVQFAAFPDAAPLDARVGRIGPLVAKERRTLRVTFELHDKTTRLLPGMYADVGLGTERRDVVTVPADAVLHAGRHDYVLVEESRGRYRARIVDVEEAVAARSSTGSQEKAGSRIVVGQGLKENERVVAGGAILLKPLLVKSLGDAINR